MGWGLTFCFSNKPPGDVGLQSTPETSRWRLPPWEERKKVQEDGTGDARQCRVLQEGFMKRGNYIGNWDPEGGKELTQLREQWEEKGLSRILKTFSIKWVKACNHLTLSSWGLLKGREDTQLFGPSSVSLSPCWIRYPLSVTPTVAHIFLITALYRPFAGACLFSGSPTGAVSSGQAGLEALSWLCSQPACQLVCFDCVRMKTGALQNKISTQDTTELWTPWKP